MIIKGNSRAGGAELAAHLLNAETNERVKVLEVNGTISQDLFGAFKELEAAASGTRCKKPLYHANIDPDRTVTMTPDQWQRSIELLEKELGLTGHPRVTVMHTKYGRDHFHVVWGRVSPDTMRAMSDSHNYRKHELVSRQLEREFGHERVQGAHVEREGVARPARTPPVWEMQQGAKLAVDPRMVKEAVKEFWEKSDGAQSFVAALEHAGLTLAQGNRRDFVVIDHAGGIHSLGRCVGVKAAELRTRMADVDRNKLPTVEEVREKLREQGGGREKKESKTMPEFHRDEIKWNDALSKAAIEKEKRPTSTNQHRPDLSKRTKAPPTKEYREVARASTGRIGKAHRAVGKAPVRAVGKAFGAAEKIVEGLLSFFDPGPPRTPEQKEAAAQAKQNREEAVDQRIDWQKFQVDREHAAKQQLDRDDEPKLNRGRGGRER